MDVPLPAYAKDTRQPGVDWENMDRETNSRRKARLRRASALALALASVFVVTGAATVASAAPALNDDELRITYTNYSTVDEILEQTVAHYGAAPVARLLKGLAEAARTGQSTGFPGMDGLSGKEAASALSRAAQAVSAGTDIPEDVAERSQEVAPLGDLSPMSAPSASTPSHYTVAGQAISNNRAWQWTLYLNESVCQFNICNVVNQKSVRHTITPYQTSVRVEAQTLVTKGNGVGTPHTVARVYQDPSGARLGSKSWSGPSTGHNTQYVSVSNLWVSGKRIIVGVETHVKPSSGGPEIKVTTRTLTASCFSSPQNYCAWWV